MYSVILSTIFSVIAATLFIWSRYTGKEKLSIYLKVIASSGFLLIAVLSYIANDVNNYYFHLIIFALILGFFGDVMLGLKNLIAGKKYYLISIGVTFFLLGHITYSINFMYQSGVYWWVFVINIAVAAVIMNMTRVLNFSLSRTYKILGYIYSYTISLMLMSAISFFLSFSPSIVATMILVGSVSFYISDCLLSASYFKQDIPCCKNLNVIVHSTYYLAQILLALSVYFV